MKLQSEETKVFATEERVTEVIGSNYFDDMIKKLYVE